MQFNILSMIVAIVAAILLFMIPRGAYIDLRFEVNKSYKHALHVAKNRTMVAKDLLKRKDYKGISENESKFLIALGKRVAYIAEFERTRNDDFKRKAKEQNVLMANISVCNDIKERELRDFFMNQSEDIFRLYEYNIYLFGDKHYPREKKKVECK